jgi:hypothetical protein
MTTAILNLEKRQAKVNRMLNCFKCSNDPEDVSYETGIRKFQKVLYKITQQLQAEWNKTYNR